MKNKLYSFALSMSLVKIHINSLEGRFAAENIMNKDFRCSI